MIEDSAVTSFLIDINFNRDIFKNGQWVRNSFHKSSPNSPSSNRAFFVVGGLLVTTAAAGKGAIYLYRAVKSGSAVGGAATKVGSYYRGGFEKAMTSREAALILGIR